MKKYILLMILTLNLSACTMIKDSIVKDEVKEVEPTPAMEEMVETDEHDRYGNSYVDDAIIIKSDELVDMVVDFWTKFSMGDASCVDYLYLSEGRAKGLKNLLSTEEGRKAVVKMVEKSTLTSDGVPDAKFLRLDADSDGNIFLNQNSSELIYRGKSYRYFWESIAIKNTAPLTNVQDILDYIDRYNEYYEAEELTTTAVNFVYVDGKAKIDGETFLSLFGLFKELDHKTELLSDLVANAYYEDAEISGDLLQATEYLANGEYIWVYETIRKAGLVPELRADPTPSIRLLYDRSPEVRNQFLADMRRLPPPLVRAVKTGGSNKVICIYYYPNSYEPSGANEILEGYFEMRELKDFDPTVLENVIKNLLSMQGIKIDEILNN
ncbi:MAG: hypothetical protein MR314_02175 [Ezakiella sp.]|nr:hypothetical protein [Ezakiella sp.]